jgi:hypothetical protein
MAVRLAILERREARPQIPREVRHKPGLNVIQVVARRAERPHHSAVNLTEAPGMRLMMVGMLAVVAAVQPVQQSPSVEITIGKSVAGGMAVDTASAFDAGVGQVAGWTRVTGLAAGTKITHLWIHGADSTRIELTIGGSPWRTYSRKTVPPGSSGEWKLEVLGPDGTRIASRSFRVG